MDAHIAAKLVGNQKRARRTHAGGPSEALCGASLAGAIATDVDPDTVTCLACRAKLRDSGDLPMTRHATARRKGVADAEARRR